MLSLARPRNISIPPRPQADRGRLTIGPFARVTSGAYFNTASGSYRVADSALVGYLLYRGVDASPNLSGAAWETFTSLPHETAVLASSHVYRFVLRRRNAWGLISQNLAEWVLRVNGSGGLDPVKPSNATELTLTAAAAGTVLVSARYTYAPDGDNQADAFLIFLRSNGTDPVPSSDTPTEVAMVKSDGVAKLDWTSAAFGEGADVRVIVRTRRNGTPDVDSDSATVLHVTATLLGPSAPSAGLFIEGGPELQ